MATPLEPKDALLLAIIAEQVEQHEFELIDEAANVRVHRVAGDYTVTELDDTQVNPLYRVEGGGSDDGKS